MRRISRTTAGWILAALVVSQAASAVPAAPAVAATNGNGIGVRQLLSVDGSTFHDDLTGHLAVQPGQTVTVRVQYDNAGSVAGISSSVLNPLPDGFTLVPGSTRNCITPSAGEIVCNTDAGQGGAIDEGKTWYQGRTLIVSPTAGLYDLPGDQNFGILEIGKKRYLNFQNCDIGLLAGENTDDTYGFRPGNQPGSFYCGPASPGTYIRVAQSVFQPVDIMGRRYVNGQDCDYALTRGWNTDDIVGFNPNNVRGSFTCGESADPAVALRPLHSAFFLMDHLGQRYLNFQVCSYILANGLNTDSIIGFNPHVVAGRITCGASSDPNVLYRPEHSGFDPIDLLDPARGKGFIEFRMRAPSQPGVYVQSSWLSTSNLGAVQDDARIEVLGPATPPSSSSSSSSSSVTHVPSSAAASVQPWYPTASQASSYGHAYADTDADDDVCLGLRDAYGNLAFKAKKLRKTKPGSNLLPLLQRCVDAGY